MYIRGIRRDGLATDADLGGLRIGLVSTVDHCVFCCCSVSWQVQNLALETNALASRCLWSYTLIFEDDYTINIVPDNIVLIPLI